MRRIATIPFVCFLLSTLAVAAFNPEVQPFKNWVTKCVSDVTTEFPDLESDLGLDVVKDECMDYVQILVDLFQEEGLGAVLIVQLEMGGCAKNLKNVSGIEHPILVCKNLIEKQLQCTDDLEAAGDKNAGAKCFFITVLAAKAIELSPEIAGDALANASLRDLIKLHMIDQCLIDAKARFPETWDNIGESEAIVHCTDWVDFLLNTTEKYGIGSWLHINLRMSACYHYMQGLQNVSNPIVRCKNLVKSVRECVDNYEAQGKSTEEALRLCDNETIQQAIQVRYNPELLDQLFPSGIPDTTRARIEAYIQSNPVLGDFLASLDDNQRAVFMHLTRAQQKELLQLGLQEAKLRLNRLSLRRIDEALRFRRRAISATLRDAIRTRFIASHIIYRELFQNYTIAKGNFLEVKNNASSLCAADNTSAECLEAQEEALGYAKEMLGILADIQLRALELVKDRVDESEYIDEEKAAEIVSNIDGLITQLNGAKDLLENASTKEEVKAAGSVIRSTWLTIREKIREHRTYLLRAALRSIIERARAYESRVEKALARLGAQKRASIEQLLEQYSNKVKEAEDTLESDDFAEEDSSDVLVAVGDAQEILGGIGNQSDTSGVTIDTQEESNYEVVENE